MVWVICRDRCEKCGWEEYISIDKFSEAWHLLTLDNVTISAEIFQKQRKEILDLFNEFRDIFAVGSHEFSCTDMVVIEIIEENGSRPEVYF